ncbi:MAG: ATP-binding protein [Actinomycetes bacterium]
MRSTRSRRFEHDLLPFSDPEHLLHGATRHLSSSIESGGSGLLLCSDEVRDHVLAELGPRAPLQALDRERVQRNATAALTSLRTAARHDLATGTPHVTVLGEVGSLEDPGERAEWTRYEAMLDAVLGDLPVHVVCVVHDELPVAVRRAGEQTHRHVRAGDTRRPNAAYVDPQVTLHRLAHTEPDPVEGTAPALDVAGRPALGPLRDAVRRVLAADRVAPSVVDDVVVAVNELVSNVYRHATPPARIQVWVPSDRVVVTVTDHGPGLDDPAVGYVPPGVDRMASGGMGLWLARQLSDRVDLLPGDGTFTVRLVRRR